MAEKWLKTYRSDGTFTFTASAKGLHKFYVIGGGGNGFKGAYPALGKTSNGGKGGAGGGYAVHEVMMQAGDTAEVTINAQKAVLVCAGETVTATSASGDTCGTATGANALNSTGGTGANGSSGNINVGTTNDGKANNYFTTGTGGKGAESKGKYQADGGQGGAAGHAHIINADWVSVTASAVGGTPINTDMSIGGAGGGGGGGASNCIGPREGGRGAIGGVVVEFVNTAPTTPAYIDVGDVVVAEKESIISWGASSDTNENLSGYILERSIDGSTWLEAYCGAARSITDTIARNWTTVQYRVKAYDAEGDESGYISTEKLTVVHNSPPSAPGPISLPPEIHGGTTITASWGRATDVDNNLTGYTLEQSIDGGEWTEIRNTTEITTQVPVTYGWRTVQFRVRAYDSYGAVGEYSTSQVITVINNRTPVISGEDRDLGTMIDRFEPQTYVVSDEDGDAVTVDVRLDGALKNTFAATLGAENRLEITPEEWRKVLNGPHTWTITATDSQQAAVTRTITFTKAVTSLRFQLAEPLPADAMPEKMIMSFQGAAPEGSLLTVEACNNAHDESPAWEDITNKVLTGQKHFFRNAEKTAEKWGVDIRVTLDRGSAVGDCYIHSHRGNYA